jgi:hypothetical protein
MLEQLLTIPLTATVAAVAYLDYEATIQTHEGGFYKKSDFYKYHFTVATHIAPWNWGLSREEKIEKCPILDLYSPIYPSWKGKVIVHKEPQPQESLDSPCN